MATRNGAVVTATDDAIGTIAPGLVADLAIFDGAMNVDHRAVIDAEPQDVALVLRGGEVMYGETALVDALETGCDPIDVCGASRSACVVRELGTSYTALQTRNASGYPLFYCAGETPRNEPTCIPERDGMDASYPSPGGRRLEPLHRDDQRRRHGTATDSRTRWTTARASSTRSARSTWARRRTSTWTGWAMSATRARSTPTPRRARRVDPNDRDRDMVPDTADQLPGRSEHGPVRPRR